MKNRKEEESFGLNKSINLRSMQMFNLISISRHLKSDKKIIRFIILIKIPSILILLISYSQIL